MTCKWFITMVILSPQDLGLLFPFPNGVLSRINFGNPNYLRPSWEPILQEPGAFIGIAQVP